MESPIDAVVLLAHGARDQRWLEPFNVLRAAVQEKVDPGVFVALAYMEFASPTFGDAVRVLADKGKTRVRVVPVFLSGGGHVAHDIPKLIGPEAAAHPGVRFEVSGALGEEPEVVSGMLQAVTRLARG